MARPLRLEFPGAVYHVIARGNERAAVFRDDADRRQYLERLAHYRERFGFRLLAFCLMGNHVHLAIRTGRFPLSRIMAGLQSSYVQWFNRRHRRTGHLFQGRYKAFLVQEDRYLLGLVRHIHENPVRAKLVERARDYAWSSDRHYRRGGGPQWLDVDGVLAMLGRGRRAAVAAYIELMRRGEGSDYEDVPSIGQVVKGDEAFALRRFEEAGDVEPRMKGLSEARVVAAVSRAFELDVTQLRGPARRRRLAEARWIAAYLARRLGRLPLARMSRYLHRDPSTLVRGVAGLEERIEKDRVFRRRLDGVVKQLRRGL